MAVVQDTPAFFSWRNLPRRRLAVFLAVALLLLVLATVLLARPGGPMLRDPIWTRIEQQGVWRVGMDPSFPPFESLDATGNPVGLDVDLVNEVARRMGVRAEISGVGFDGLVDAVAARRLEGAVSALPEMPWRTKEVAYSRPYADGGLVIATVPGSPVRGTADLAGRRVAAEWGSRGDALGRDLAQREEGAFELILRENADAALQALLDGSADAAIVDAVTLALFDGGRGILVRQGGTLEPDPYVVYVPRGAPILLARVNDAIDAMEADGTLGDIRRRWLGTP